jgi:hypothetical protein
MGRNDECAHLCVSSKLTGQIKRARDVDFASAVERKDSVRKEPNLLLLLAESAVDLRELRRRPRVRDDKDMEV